MDISVFCLASRSERTWKRRRHPTENKNAVRSTNLSGWCGLLGRVESGIRRSLLLLLVSFFLRGVVRDFPQEATLVIRPHLDLDEGTPTRKRLLGYRWDPEDVEGLVWFGLVRLVGAASWGASWAPTRSGQQEKVARGTISRPLCKILCTFATHVFRPKQTRDLNAAISKSKEKTTKTKIH